jgi:[ribosomal protein S18]-alanine N-acetyltransferase
MSIRRRPGCRVAHAHPNHPVEPVVYRASPADIDVMAAVHASAFAAPDAWSRDVFSLQLALPNVFGLLHPSGGLILARVAADEAEILTLAVNPATRRLGIGAALLREATTLAAAMGARALFLEVSVANIAARRLYASAGFVQAGKRPRYYSDNSDALVLRLDLAPGHGATSDPGHANGACAPRGRCPL